MKLITNTILAAFCALPGLAFSGDYCSEASSCGHTGYIFAYGGVFLENNDLDGHEPLFPSREKIDMDAGYIVGGGAGIYSDLFCGTRFEIEGLNAQNDIGRIRSDIFGGAGFVNYGFTGQIETKAIMVNALKEIPCGLTGYVGGGIGFSQNDLTLHQFNTLANSESDAALAYQFIAGVDVPVNDCVDVFLQYKLLGVGETHFERTDFVIDSHFTHNLVFGARLSF